MMAHLYLSTIRFQLPKVTRHEFGNQVATDTEDSGSCGAQPGASERHMGQQVLAEGVYRQGEGHTS